MRARNLLLLLMFAASAVGDTQHPAGERGFRPEHFYDANGFDTINVTNGNLIAMVPLGKPYSVGEGLSYSFTLYYTGNLWDDGPACHRPNEPCTAVYSKRPGDNAGFGWRISFGRLFPGASQDPGEYNTAAAKWRYEGPDGSEHLFWETAHEPQCVGGVTTDCDPVVTGILYTRDNSYLRMRSIGTSVRIIEFPDGRRHRFAFDVAKGWRITHMYTAASTVTVSTGVPSNNFVAFEYKSGATTAGVDDVEISDSHNRLHKLKMAASNRIHSVELSAFPDDDQLYAGVAATLTYTLTYSGDVDVATPCSNSTDPTITRKIIVLEDMYDELGHQWSFDYHLPGSGCDDLSGTLVKSTLPTGGSVKWWYTGQFALDLPNVVAVSRRSAFDVNDAKLLDKTYEAVGYEGMAVSTLVNAGLPDFSVDSKTIYYRRYWTGPDIGLPYTITARSGMIPNPDSAGRYLSTESFKCNPSSGTCPSLADRATYVKYEMDQKIGDGCVIGDACEVERNRRPFSERTLYVGDGGRVADTVHSRFDGLGHYRDVTTSGTFDAGNARTTVTEYNPTVGTYAVASNGTRISGFTMISSSSPWLLNNPTQTSVTEGGVTERRQFCFDASNGLLLRQRALYSDTPHGNDLLTVYTRAANSGSRGSVTLEQRYGGDNQALDVGDDLCSIPLPSADQLRLEQTWVAGTLATSRYIGSGGAPMSFYNVNRIIDRATGLVRSETDAAGRKTSYEYDELGRLLWTKPLSGGWTRTAYTPTQVEILEMSQGTDQPAPTADVYPTSTMGGSQWQFDSLGRLEAENRLIADGSWSTRLHQYDTAGRKYFVSEAGTTTMGTTSGAFDAYGRPWQVTAADGSVTSFVYRGVREIDRTVSIAGATGPQASTTTETFDRQGRLWRVKEPSGAAGALVTTTYAYDQGGRLTTVTMAGAEGTQTRLFTYDKRGLLQKERHPEKGGTGNGYTYYYNYDANGRAGRRVDNPWDLLFTYDRAERLAEVRDRSPSRPWKTFTYGTSGSANGRLLSAVRHNYHDRLALDVAITETYEYNGIGGRVSKRSTRSTTGPMFEQTFEYDERGNTRTFGYPKCTAVCTNLPQVPTVTNAYTNGYLTAVSGNALGVDVPGATSITYHASGLVASVVTNSVPSANKLVWQQDVATTGMPRPLLIKTTGGTGNLSLNGFAYDGAGNITTDGVDTFSYDKVSRLVSSTVAGTTQQLTYDSFGNIKTIGATTLSPSPTTNRLPSSLATYSVDGAVTAFGGDLFDLDPFGMIQAVHDPTYTSKYWAFVYTADDERIWKYDMGPANTSWWKIRDLGGKPLSEFVNVGETWTATSSYIYRNGTLLGRYAPGTSYPKRWFAVDHLGTPRRTFAENGVLLETVSYHPFGSIASLTTLDESLRFTGHERDTAIAGGIDYMHARFHASSAGRFLSVDPTWDSADLGKPQSWNRYSYVMNNPVNMTDPDGKCPICIDPKELALATYATAAEFVADYVLEDGSGLDPEPRPDLERPAVSGAVVIAYQVGPVDKLRAASVGDGIDIHHAPQAKPAGQVISNYNPAKAPGMALPTQEHKAIPTQKGTYTGTARDLVAKDVRDLRNHTKAPNSAIQKLVKLIKEEFPAAMKRVF
jgi:RHS repeat-associated protein